MRDRGGGSARQGAGVGGRGGGVTPQLLKVERDAWPTLEMLPGAPTLDQTA